LALIVGCVNYGWAEDTENITFPSSSSNVDKKDTGVSVVGTNVSVSITKGTGSNLATNTDGTRIYNGNVMTFSSTTKKISKIVFTYKRNKKQTNGVSANNGSFTTAFTIESTTESDLSATWAAANETTASVTFTVGSGSGNYALNSAVITFVGSTTPTSCATPTFSPVAGAVAYGTEIAISSSTDGATIYYTTDGTEPTTSSSHGTAGTASATVTVNATVTIKAIAVKDGLDNSEVGSAAYTIQAPTAPTFSIEGGMVTKGETVTLSSATGTTIRYTTDGTTPTASVGTVYSTPITINAAQTIKAVAYDAGSNCSTVASYAFTVFDGIVVTFDATKDTGTSLSKNGVSFTTSATESSMYKFYKSSTTTFSVSNGKIVRIEFTGVSGNPASGFGSQSGWTTDGDDGTWTGTASSVSFTASGAQVRATKIKVYVNVTATPAFSVAEGEYSEAKSVEITCATDGATIYYTTDGSTPTSSSTTYSSAILVTESMTLKAIAIKDGVESGVATAAYTMIRPAAPTFDVAEGVFDEAFDLHLATETAEATIYYTTDGSTPTTISSVYSDKVAISTETTTVKAIAVKNGLTSNVASVTYTYDARITPTFILSTTSVPLKVNDISAAVTLTTNSDGTIAFTCADAHVTLTGTGNSRTISANAAGEYTVNVSVTGSDTYKDADGVITVTVTKKATTMTINTTFPEGTDLKTASTGSIEGIVKYNDVALDPQPTVTYSSSDEKVATVNASGVITFKKVGTTTITASYEGNDEYVECEANYELTLINTTPQETTIEVTTNYAWLGVSSGSNLTVFPTEIDCSGVTATISGAGTKTRGDDTYIRLYAKNTLKLEAPTGYRLTEVVFDHKTGSNTVIIDNGTWTSSTHTWTGNDNDVTFTIDGTSGNNQINGFTVTLAPTVTISASGWTSLASAYDLDFSSAEEQESVPVVAYAISSIKKTSVTLTPHDAAPAGVGMILKGNPGSTYSIPVTTSVESFDNELSAAVNATAVAANSVYAVSGGKLKLFTGIEVPAGKAYLLASKVPAEAHGLTLDFDEDGETTGIAEISSKKGLLDGDFYDLSGRKVAQPTKGLYIMNGKKVIIK